MNLPKVRLDFNFPSQLVFDVSFLELWLEQHLSRDNHNAHSYTSQAAAAADQVYCHSKVAHDGRAPIAPSCPRHPSKQLWCLPSGPWPDTSLKCRQEKSQTSNWPSMMCHFGVRQQTEYYQCHRTVCRSGNEAGNRRSYSQPPSQAIMGMSLKCLPWEPPQICSSSLEPSRHSQTSLYNMVHIVRKMEATGTMMSENANLVLMVSQYRSLPTSSGVSFEEKKMNDCLYSRSFSANKPLYTVMYMSSK